jgi:integrase/recombinase XerD
MPLGTIRAQRIQMSDGRASWTVLGVHGPIRPVDSFLAFATAVGRAENTIRAYAHDLALWCRFLEVADAAWDSATLDEVGSFVAWLQTPTGAGMGSPNGRCRSTVDRILSSLFRFYDFHVGSAALSNQLILYTAGRKTVGRTRGHRRPTQVGRSERLPRTLSLDQVQTLLMACRSRRDQLLLSLWWTAGLRVGQTLGLRHEDFDGRRNQVHIRRRQNANNAWSKSSRAWVIPITPELVALHREYMFEEYGDIDCDYVFVVLSGPTRGRPMSADTVAKMVANLRRRSGIDFTPHVLRHTFATEFLRDGGRIEVLSEMLTHSSTESTRVYLHLTVDDLRRELDRRTR